MNEENKRPGTELNDAALEQASGGGQEVRVAMSSAGSMCDRCKIHRGENRYCDGGTQMKLCDYLLAGGRVDKFEQCPFLKSTN